MQRTKISYDFFPAVLIPHPHKCTCVDQVIDVVICLETFQPVQFLLSKRHPVSSRPHLLIYSLFCTEHHSRCIRISIYILSRYLLKTLHADLIHSVEYKQLQEILIYDYCIVFDEILFQLCQIGMCRNDDPFLLYASYPCQYPFAFLFHSFPLKGICSDFFIINPDDLPGHVVDTPVMHPGDLCLYLWRNERVAVHTGCHKYFSFRYSFLHQSVFDLFFQVIGGKRYQ